MSYTLADTYNSYSRDYIHALTASEFRALELLHELRHVQGTLDVDHNNHNFVGENEAIVDRCFPNAGQREPNAAHDAA